MKLKKKKSMKTKSWCFEKVSKIHKPLAGLKRGRDREDTNYHRPPMLHTLKGEGITVDNSRNINIPSIKKDPKDSI